VKALLFVAGVIVAGVVGYLLGDAGTFGREDGSREGARAADRRGVVVPAGYTKAVERDAEIEALKVMVEQLSSENEKLRRAADPEASGEELPVGTRRKNGSIVGGARWNRNFELMAVGFLDTMLSQYLKEANLTPAQEKRLRGEMQVRVKQAMQIGADYTNGDIDGDRAYELAGIVSQDIDGSLSSFLDDKQYALLGKFQSGMGNFVRDHIVNGEVVTFRNKLKLDGDQEKKIRAIVNKRYQRVYERIGVPIPNVMMKAMRRSQDEDIYRETGDAIKALLTPDQAATFDAVERTQPAQIHAFRSNLVPK